MDFSEAMDALAEGKFVKRRWWDSYLNENGGDIHFSDPYDILYNYQGPYDFERDDYEATDWMIFSKE